MYANAIAIVLLACALACQCAPEGGKANVRTGTGVKQGPLLMIDRMKQDAEEFLAAGAEAGAAGETWLDARLEAAQAPGDAGWLLPEVPQFGEGVVLFTAPFESGCCTTCGGTGRAQTPRGKNRGELAIELDASGGKYAYAVDSPCLNFRSPVDGMVKCRTGVVVNGLAGMDTGQSGQALSRLSVWIAHCHPKDKGRFSEKVAWQMRDVSGAMSFENALLTHEAVMPVQAGVDYSFGTGISALCAATGSGRSVARLWGRLVFFAVEFTAAESDGD